MSAAPTYESVNEKSLFLGYVTKNDAKNKRIHAFKG